MGWRIVHIKEGELLRLKLDNVEIVKLSKKVYVPLSDINMIILEGNRTTITTKLLVGLSHNNIGLVICDDKYLPVGMYLPYGQYHHAAKRVIEQAQWTTEQKAIMWRQVIGQKMKNQVAFARYKGIEQERLEIMEHLIVELTDGDLTNREGHVAKVYFDSLFGNSFTRDDEVLANYAMNFGYAIERSCVARCVVGDGLNSMLGIFHHNEFNSFNLADDLMEPFRPLMDYWIDKQVLAQDDYLSYEARIKLIDFMNQTMIINRQQMSMDHVMQLFVQSFITAMTTNDPTALLEIKLQDFI
ncbi:type II CRISPR-associated endonuclease Cas1 [Bombilactobacillus folatiphilus]|uniref:CRISPR-associated endonuclease Cas1 n=1 Tax=Bombilactobacillus folatiphilus TaxID=2923362 RepID=A0ABY4PAC6_9LACO|nr:type II CRISPR-associated endonuclease Cas1 [Bombilactobacillus folatiphilus]UQS82622.1 type II CRISPR-associated endonuclease Cas1 [Bombilactobacillus folatiphilus]